MRALQRPRRIFVHIEDVKKARVNVDNCLHKARLGACHNNPYVIRTIKNGKIPLVGRNGKAGCHPGASKDINRLKLNRPLYAQDHIEPVDSLGAGYVQYYWGMYVFLY